MTQRSQLWEKEVVGAEMVVSKGLRFSYLGALTPQTLTTGKGGPSLPFIHIPAFCKYH